MRLRLRYSKLGKPRFLSHRDLARIWERAARRARLPVAYSQGFNPRPKLHFGLALSVGYESLAEYLDLDLTESVDLDGLEARISDRLPDGVEVVAIGEPTDKTSLQAAVDVVSWRFTIEPDAGLDQRLAALLADDERMLMVTRKGKDVDLDLRPLVRRLDLSDDGTVLAADIDTALRSVRPAEFLAEVGIDVTLTRVRRLEQWVDHDGHMKPVLPLPAPTQGVTELIAGTDSGDSDYEHSPEALTS
jgi:radical SAM-linked protein